MCKMKCRKQNTSYDVPTVHIHILLDDAVTIFTDKQGKNESQAKLTCHPTYT